MTITTDQPSFMLGRKPARIDPRTLRLGAYLTAALPPPPVARDWLSKVDTWPMFDNDRIGDCTFASAGHCVLGWSAYAGTPVVLPDAAIVEGYSTLTGYTPNNPASDQGAVELDVLNFWRRNGIGGHTITAYAAADPSDHRQVRSAIDIFGGCYIGINLPLSARTQVRRGTTWRPVRGPNGRPRSWGGHAVHIAAYDRAGLTCITWGRKQRMSWAFWSEYVEEAYALVSPDWISAAGTTPQGLNLIALMDDLHKVTS